MNTASPVRTDTAVTCPWCRAFWQQRPGVDCGKCGGPLPAPAGEASLAAPPPPTPRKLPEAYRKNVMFYKNVHAIVGLVFLLVIVLAPVGFFLWRHGRRQGRRTLEALERGIAAQGRIVGVTQVTTETINGRHPYRIEYAYLDAGGQERVGGAKSWDPSAVARRSGEPTWVVYVPGPEELSSLWPPVI